MNLYCMTLYCSRTYCLDVEVEADTPEQARELAQSGKFEIVGDEYKHANFTILQIDQVDQL